MVVVGDNLYDWYMLEAGSKGDGSFDFTGWYDHIAPYAKMADIAVINQETLLGGDGGYQSSEKEILNTGYTNRWGSYHGFSAFNTPDEVAYEVIKAGFNVFTMATNHSWDFGYKALKRTVEFTRTLEGVTTLGIHDSIEDRDTIRIVEKNGIRIAMLNYTYGTNYPIYEEEGAFAVDRLSKERIESDVKKAREAADFVVVFPHWGEEYELTPNSSQKNYTKIFLDCGVDVVVGCHPHVCQTMEVLTSDTGHKMAVYYSVGNFLSVFKSTDCQLEAMAYIELCIDGDEKYIKENTVIPLVNHWNYDSNVFGKRKNFTVYALQDYSKELAAQHGCTMFGDGAGFSYDRMKNMAVQFWGDNIKTVEFK